LTALLLLLLLGLLLVHCCCCQVHVALEKAAMTPAHCLVLLVLLLLLHLLLCLMLLHLLLCLMLLQSQHQGLCCYLSLLLLLALNPLAASCLYIDSGNMVHTHSASE
jgi:hypothetical protein